MSDPPFPGLAQAEIGTAGPMSLFLAPSDQQASTALHVLPKSHQALNELLGRLLTAQATLRRTLESVATASREMMDVFASVRALHALTVLLDERQHLYWTTPERSMATLRNKFEVLFTQTLVKCGDKVNGRSLSTTLDDAVKSDARAILNLLNDPQYQKTVQTFAKDASIPTETRHGALQMFSIGVQLCLDEVARTEHETDVANAGRKAIEDPASSPTLMGCILKETKSLAETMVPATSQVGSNLITPDGLTLTLLKIYSLRYLPPAAAAQGKASALSEFLLSSFKRALNLSSRDKDTLDQLCVRVRKATTDHLQASKRTLLFQNRASGAKADPRLEQAKVDEVAAETAVKLETEHVAEFLNVPGRFVGMQKSAGVDASFTIFSVIMLCDAFAQIADPDANAIQAVQHGVDAIAFTASAGMAAIRTLRGPVRVAAVKLFFAANEEYFEVMDKAVGRGTAVLAAVTGGLQVLDALIKGDWKEGITGAVSAGSGLAIWWGLLAGGAEAGGWAVWFVPGGEIAGILLAAYAIGSALVEASKPDTQKVIEGAISELETNATSWNSVSVIKNLGLEAELAAVKSAADSTTFYLIPRAKEEGQSIPSTRDDLIRQLVGFGFDKDTAGRLVESDADLHPRTGPMYTKDGHLM